MIRIRYPQGTTTFALNPTSTLSELQAFIENQCGIATLSQELKVGYPPKPLTLIQLSPNELLSSPSIGLSRGDQVVVLASSAIASANLGSLPPPPPIAAVSAPPSAPSAVSSAIQDGQVSVALSDGYLTLKVIPDDNSCLFNSVGFLLYRRIGTNVATQLRQTVANTIRGNSIDYSDVVLGQPRSSYISKIQSPQTWGGAIELSILSSHFAVEIVSIDVASGVLHRFGEDRGYDTRMMVVYSGIHYDALVQLPHPQASSEFGTTVFPITDHAVLQAAQQLVSQLKQRNYYTDTASFSLKCKVCGHKVKGEKEALVHAKSTGHADFGEV